MCTSRPEAFFPYSGCKVIKINGFNKESIDKYISKAFEKLKNGEEMACKFKSQIHNNPVIWSILHIPINVAILCLIFSHSSTLPRTLTELYTLLCKRLILRYINTRTPNVEQVEELQSLEHLPSGISEQFSQLCYVAYKGMEGKMVIFSSQDLAKFGVDKGNWRKMGLLLFVPSISVAGREMSYSFLHLTLQEFCAAWYISKRCPEEQMKVISIYHLYKNFKMVWRFYCGITKLQNKEVFDYILPYKLVKSPLSDWKASELACFAYETGNSELCQIVGDYFKDSFSVIDLDKLESHAIKYILAQYRGLLRLSSGGLEVLFDWSLQHNKDGFQHSLEDIAVKHCNSIHELHIRGQAHIRFMSHVLSSSKTLKVLHIQHMFHNYDVIKCLANNNTLRDLRMNHCRLIDTELGEMLAHNQSIRSIDLSNNYIEDGGVEKLVHHLMSNNTLYHLNLSSNKITEVGANHLRKLLTRNCSSLASIELSNNPLKDKGVDLLLQSLSIGTEHIGLCNVQMTSLSYQSLGDALHKVKSISFDQIIDFTPIRTIYNQEESKESLTDKYLFTKSISSLLCTTALEHLEIRLTDLASHKLINFIGQNENIKTLKLHYCIQGVINEDNWIVELTQFIQHNKSLTKLMISGEIKNSKASSFVELLADSLSINTSIKSLVYELEIGVARFSMTSRNAYNFVNKLKENTTLEKLTLKKVKLDVDYHDLTLQNVSLKEILNSLDSIEDVADDHILKVENYVHQLNKARGAKSVAKLTVNITFGAYLSDFLTSMWKPLLLHAREYHYAATQLITV